MTDYTLTILARLTMAVLCLGAFLVAVPIALGWEPLCEAEDEPVPECTCRKCRKLGNR